LLKGCGVKDIKHIKEPQSQLKIKVYMMDIGKIVDMDLEEYILGVVAGEMPAGFHVEALKAQALAARTYTLLRMKAFGGNGCTMHPGADICTDSTNCQAYRNPKTVKKDLNKLKKAVSDTAGEVIVFQGHLIDAVFFSTSGGKTENSEDIWSSKVPYLRSVMSQYEEQSPKLMTQKEIDINTFISYMKEIEPSIKLSKKNMKKQIAIMERSDGGSVMQIKVGNKVMKGTAIRQKLGLNSANFKIEYSLNKMIFTVLGYGHGIGMSQYGADGMARNGSDYKEIINHYYQGVDIVKYDALNANSQTLTMGN